MQESHSFHSMERQDTVRYTETHKRALVYKEGKLKGRQPKDFIGGMIGRESVEQAEAYVARMDEAFAHALENLHEDEKEKLERSKIIAECLEGIILYNKNWFGLMASTYPTTKYDDYRHGVDMIVERTQDGFAQHEGVAMDITYAGKNGIAKKVNRIVDNLKKGRLGTVSFFKSNDGGFKGELNNLPLVVIGADFNTMSNMINLFAEDTPRNNHELAEHPFQFQMIDEVIIQCDTYIQLIQTFDLPKEAKDIMITVYTKLRKTYADLYKVKSEKTLKHVDRSMRDKFYSNLESYLQNLLVPPQSE